MYPGIIRVGEEFSWLDQDLKTKTTVKVEPATPESLLRRGRTLVYPIQYTEDDQGNRASRIDRLYAIENMFKPDLHLIFNTLSWSDPKPNQAAKDVFSTIRPLFRDRVPYLIWASYYVWISWSTNKVVERSLELTVYTKPEGKTWNELIEDAEKLQSEQELAKTAELAKKRSKFLASRKGHPKRKLAKLFEEFPFLSTLNIGHSRHESQHAKVTLSTRIVVQKTDSEVLYLRRNPFLRNMRSHISEGSSGNDYRGTRDEIIYAVDNSEQFIAFSAKPIAPLEEVLKDIFKDCDPDKVSYLAWVNLYRWFEPPTKDALEEDPEKYEIFGKEQIGSELEIIVYTKPKDKSWKELIHEAEMKKAETDSAYLYPPKEMPALSAVEDSLGQGFRLHAFLSGAGLRCVSLSRNGKQRAYGEHPHIDQALSLLEQDVLPGGQTYEHVYGGKNPHYLTGSSLSTSNIDYWVRRGNTIDVWRDEGDFVCSLEGYEHDERMPEWVRQWTCARPGQPMWYGDDRGFLRKCIFLRHLFPNGEDGHELEIIQKPKEKSDSYFYKIIKTGRGKTVWEAIIAALKAPSRELIK